MTILDFLVFALINFKDLLFTDPARIANKFSLCDQIYTKLFRSLIKLTGTFFYFSTVVVQCQIRTLHVENAMLKQCGISW